MQEIYLPQNCIVKTDSFREANQLFPVVCNSWQFHLSRVMCLQEQSYKG